MSDQDPAPELHIDADWKAEAQAEKERLAEKEAAASSTPDQGGAPGELPEANFKSLMGLLASQAIMGLGAYPDPETGAAVIDLVGSKFAIDLLGVLEEKTSGNISDDESKELSEILGQLRSRFVQIADAVAQQQMKEATEGIAPGQPPAGGVIQTP
jgi:hypothetical protein